MKDEADDGGSQPEKQPPRASFGGLQQPLPREAREDRHWQPVHHSLRPAIMEVQAEPYAAHLAMLDERQQNRARKLEQETEEVNGRWRTIQSAMSLEDDSPLRPSRSRREPDRAVAVDSYQPNGRSYHPSQIEKYRPNQIDAYRPSESPSIPHPSDETKRPYEMKPLRSPEPDTAFRLANKRKLDDETTRADVSNKSSTQPSQSARCGKRKCNNMAMKGKDRCDGCYQREGRRPGVSIFGPGGSFAQFLMVRQWLMPARTRGDAARQAIAITASQTLSEVICAEPALVLSLVRSISKSAAVPSATTNCKLVMGSFPTIHSDNRPS